MATEPPPAALPSLTRVPWTGLSVLLVWLVGELCLFGCMAAAQGGAHYLHGPDWQKIVGPPGVTMLSLYAHLAALPLRLTAGILVVHSLSQAMPADMGLTAHRLLRNILLGVALAVPLAVAVYAVQYGCETILRELGADVVQEHQFTKLAKSGLTPWQWAVLITVAVVAAPVWEEFLFRGLVQPWAVDYLEAPPVLMAVAVTLAVLLRFDRFQNAWAAGKALPWLEWLPLIVALALVPVFLVLRVRFRSPVPAALFASAVLFGWFHASVWPSPVSLTVLAIGLGWLRHATGSLAGPIALHAAFNAIAVVVLMYQVS